jgi:hypothetical protein
MTWPNVRNYTLTRNHRQSASVSRRFSSFSARFLKTSRMALNGPVNRKLKRWSRLAGQNGGLAKVDSGFDYAANLSSFACVA